MGEREECVFMAKLAEEAQRYDDMVQYMRRVALLDVETTAEERNLLSVAYKNTVGPRRASWRIVTSLKEKQESSGELLKVQITKKFLSKIEQELTSFCNEILTLADQHLIPTTNSGESKVFYHRMKGDYYRYLSEFQTGMDREISSQKSQECYNVVANLSRSQLPATHPTRLGLALSLAVFNYEILNMPDRACQIAKQAFDDAIAELDNLDETNYKDSTLILQLLKDNLVLWTNDEVDNQTNSTKDKD